MHDEEGPRRLRQGADTPEPLLRALAALRKGVDDSARLERVGQKLEAVMNAPKAAEAAVASGRGFMGNKLSTLKLVVGGLGLLAPLLFFQFMDDATVPPSSLEGSPQPSAAAQNAEPVAAPTEPASAAVEVAAAAAPAAREEAVAVHAAKPLVAAARPRKQRERVAAPSTRDEQNDQDDHGDQRARVEPAGAGEANNPVQVAGSSDSEASAASSAPQAAKEKAPREAAVKADAPPAVSEASLLLQARQALKNDPTRALRLATQHQTLFASGRLTPEREVLAIEALRKLDRTREADERLRKFEAQYPSSIHLKRLHEKR